MDASPGWIPQLHAILGDPDTGAPALQRAADLLVASFASFAAVFGTGEDGVIPVLAAAHREPPLRDAWVDVFRGSGEPARDPDCVVARVLRSGTPILGLRLGDGWTMAPQLVMAAATEAGPRALIAVPLTAGGEALGVLVLARAGDDPPFHPADLALAGTIARPLSLSRDHARLRAAVERLRADAAERRRAEEELRGSEARLAGIVALATEAIISIDPERRITHFNHGAEQVFGYAADEALGRELEMLLPARFRGIHAPAVRAFARSGVAARRMGERGEIAGVRKNGEEFPAEASISHLEVGGRTVLNVVLRDVTGRKRVEAELADALAHAQRSRAEAEAAAGRARFLADAGAELAASLDYEATLAAVTRMAVPVFADYCVSRVRADDGTLQLVGVAHADPAREPPLRELVRRSSSAAGVRRGLDRVLETGTPEIVADMGEAEWAALALEPAERALADALTPGSYVLAPLRARGRTLGVISLVYAESGRRYTPADLPLLHSLADRAALAVDSARLYAAARDATRARDDTLRVVAHDIGNSLAAARLHAGLCVRLLAEDHPADAAREHARQIVELTAQMQRLRQDLLDAASLEAGALAMRFTPVDAAELVEEALERIAPLAAEKDVTLASDLPETLPVIAADMERLLQAMGNLLGNAVKFTPPGGSVTVRAEGVGGAVRVSVSDTGPGIAPEHLPHVFDRFWRIPGAGGVGTGLGLAIAHGIVEVHQGRLEVESAAGEGTTFRITVPARPPSP